MFSTKATMKATTSELPKTFCTSCGANCRISGTLAMPTPNASEMPTIMRLR